MSRPITISNSAAWATNPFMTARGPERPLITYLITGGSGTLGRALITALLPLASTKRIIVFSRGEHRQAALQADYPDPRLECWIGDVRDRNRLEWAFDCRPDVIIHAAALKRVESCEGHTDEARKTNIDGTHNVVELAMRADVPKVLVVSSDKACSPETAYGATKAAAEALAIGQNAWRGSRPTRISCVRYGNILDSQGAFLHTILKHKQTGHPLMITDPRASRFWWSGADAAQFILTVLDRMHGAEIFVPKLVSARVIDLVKALAPDVSLREGGMRGAEKIHEAMINQTEAAYTYELPDCYVLLPKLGQWWSALPPHDAIKVPAGFSYSSDQDPLSVSVEAAV